MTMSGCTRADGVNVTTPLNLFIYNVDEFLKNTSDKGQSKKGVSLQLV